jgi:hypothetical protein
MLEAMGSIPSIKTSKQTNKSRIIKCEAIPRRISNIKGMRVSIRNVS